ncbi:MAG: hypothetical protein CMN84_08610 [Spongiibacteraceae bacterium]|nr:hypothetical protein [Spongiibacteraceae bacterium]
MCQALAPTANNQALMPENRGAQEDEGRAKERGQNVVILPILAGLRQGRSRHKLPAAKLAPLRLGCAE